MIDSPAWCPVRDRLASACATLGGKSRSNSRHRVSLTNVLTGDFEKHVRRLVGFKAHMSEPMHEMGVAEQFDPPDRESDLDRSTPA